MQSHIRFLDYDISFATGKIRHGLDTTTLRPKTLELLSVLIEAKGQVVTKSQILSEVWSDVIVDEQVIFQSIKEIRKCFTGQDVIKTHPRKGYAWIMPVEVVPPESPTTSLIAPEVQNQTITARLPNLSSRILISAFVFLTLLFALWLWFVKEPDTVTGSVMILPVKNAVEDNNMDWVEYGLMDQIIGRLNASEQNGVLPTDYVFEVLRRANASNQPDKNQIQQIFQVSGVNLLVQLTIAGARQDYQLVYAFYSRDKMEQGVIIGATTSELVQELTDTLAAKLGTQTADASQAHYAAFNDALLANAIKAKLDNKNDTAGLMLRALIDTSPDNYRAKRLLAELQIATAPHDYESNRTFLMEAMQQAAEVDDKKEWVRLKFWSSVNEAQTGLFELALQSLELAREQAKSHHDWLYLAYIEELTATILKHKSRLKEATDFQLNAYQYHQILECPVGQSQSLLNLAQLAHQQGNSKQALNYLEQSKTLITTRGLTRLRQELNQIEQQLSPTSVSTKQ